MVGVLTGRPLAFTDDYFPEMDKDEADRRIIDNQLKELGSLFSEDE